MTLPPLWRTRLTATGAAVLAVWLGVGLAQQEYFWPLLITGSLLLLAFRHLFSVPIDTLLLGFALVGYLAGNRGFAQISLSGNFPLLPAEFTLLIAGLIMIVQCAFRSEAPFRRERLNYIILIWIILCGARLIFDVRAYGFSAIRDFALVYYAGFFFLAQAAANEMRNVRWLHACLIVGCFSMAILHQLTPYFPGFFLSTLVLRGNPVIYFKGDLVGTMLCAVAVMIFVRYQFRQHTMATIATLVLLGFALTTNNRASMVGLGTVTILLLLGRQWRFAATQALAGVVAVFVILFFAYLTNTSWRQTPLHGVYDRVVSITDPFGQKTYSGENTYYKGDNNRFRMVWWNAVIQETLDGNPWTGLGFGHDIAQRFVREYYPEQGDEFNTRSPHNVVLTVFARAGLMGLLPFLLISLIIVGRIIKAARNEDPALGMWCLAWVILVSACFGVVLEGPMGAVVFWIALGLANGMENEVVTITSDPELPPEDHTLS